MTRILIDTDVIFDFFFDRAPFSESAAKILSLCEVIKNNKLTIELNGYDAPATIYEKL